MTFTTICDTSLIFKMADNEQKQSGTKPVDEAPISPIERKNSLENHLMHRPDRAALIDSKWHAFQPVLSVASTSPFTAFSCITTLARPAA